MPRERAWPPPSSRPRGRSFDLIPREFLDRNAFHALTLTAALSSAALITVDGFLCESRVELLDFPERSVSHRRVRERSCSVDNNIDHRKSPTAWLSSEAPFRKRLIAVTVYFGKSTSRAQFDGHLSRAKRSSFEEINHENPPGRFLVNHPEREKICACVCMLRDR